MRKYLKSLDVWFNIISCFALIMGCFVLFNGTAWIGLAIVILSIINLSRK